MSGSRSMELSLEFRHAMRRLAATVCVVTCADAEGWHGMTATAVTSVSVEPPALLVCVNQLTSFYRKLGASRIFCVNLLGVPHVAISQAFSGKLRGAERFSAGNWLVARSMPYLADAQAAIFCKAESVTHFGTHGIFIGIVEEVRLVNGCGPLLYEAGHYATTSHLSDG
jgi:flavin reductase